VHSPIVPELVADLLGYSCRTTIDRYEGRFTAAREAAEWLALRALDQQEGWQLP